MRAIDMAKKAGIEPKKFRDALRKEKLIWHQHNDRWTVEIGSAEHAAMESVLRKDIRLRNYRRILLAA